MGWDTVMYAISSDNDNQDNNYTKLRPSITVTYHLNNQALNRRRRGEEKKDPEANPACTHGFIGVSGVTWRSAY